MAVISGLPVNWHNHLNTCSVRISTSTHTHTHTYTQTDSNNGIFLCNSHLAYSIFHRVYRLEQNLLLTALSSSDRRCRPLCSTKSCETCVNMNCTMRKRRQFLHSEWWNWFAMLSPMFKKKLSSFPYEIDHKFIIIINEGHHWTLHWISWTQFHLCNIFNKDAL